MTLGYDADSPADLGHPARRHQPHQHLRRRLGPHRADFKHGSTTVGARRLQLHRRRPDQLGVRQPGQRQPSRRGHRQHLQRRQRADQQRRNRLQLRQRRRADLRRDRAPTPGTPQNQLTAISGADDRHVHLQPVRPAGHRHRRRHDHLLPLRRHGLGLQRGPGAVRAARPRRTCSPAPPARSSSSPPRPGPTVPCSPARSARTMALANSSAARSPPATATTPDGTVTTTGATSPNTFEFNATQNDGTGLYLMGARYYNPATGTLHQPGPHRLPAAAPPTSTATRRTTRSTATTPPDADCGGLSTWAHSPVGAFVQASLPGRLFGWKLLRGGRALEASLGGVAAVSPGFLAGG